MRSRRQQYTDRFEELTRQEIKNYNDSLASTNLALDAFRKQIKDCVDMYANQVAQISSQLKNVESQNVDLKDSVQTLNRRLESQRHDFTKLEREKIEQDKRNADFHSWISLEFKHQFDSINRLDVGFQDCTFMMKRRVEDVFQEISHCYNKTKKDNTQLKEEILSIPSEAKKVREELLEKAAISAVDNAGLIKEVAIVNKKSFIQEKLNQYFHTQIDRLKKKREVK